MDSANSTFAWKLTGVTLTSNPPGYALAVPWLSCAGDLERHRDRPTHGVRLPAACEQPPAHAQVQQHFLPDLAG